jgi:hypothetical protein
MVSEEIALARVLHHTSNGITERGSTVTPKDRSGGDAPGHIAPADR